VLPIYPLLLNDQAYVIGLAPVERFVKFVIKGAGPTRGEPTKFATGGDVSITANVFPEGTLDNVEIFPESSVALMAK